MSGFRNALTDQWIKRSSGILHLGAHLGQEADRYAVAGKPVLWVEAMPNIHARLTEKLRRYPGQRALCTLLGDIDGKQVEFHISNNSEGVSSSIFRFGEYGDGEKTLWPDLSLSMINSISMPMLRLDTLMEGNAIDPNNYDYWVVDVQGSELLTLTGAQKSLSHCKALLVEVSTVEVYQGGVLWNELRSWLEMKGFIPLWMPEKAHDDVLFVRKEEARQVVSSFHSDHYLRHNARRLEHLASLQLDLRNKRVLEVGAGVGDHTTFYLDRACSVVTSDTRPENLLALNDRFSKNGSVKVIHLDMENPVQLDERFDIIHCYGLLYHLEHPERALEFLADHCKGLILLETCVSYGPTLDVNPVPETSHQYSQAFYGTGCRPTRPWLMEALKKLMPFVYVPKTQPAHDEFPLDWRQHAESKQPLKRSIFIASRHPIHHNSNLLAELPEIQEPQA